MSWNDVLQKFRMHSIDILRYLRDEGYITEYDYKVHKSNIKFAIKYKSNILWNLYSPKISRLAIKGWSVPEIERYVKKFTVEIDCPDSVFLEDINFVSVGTKLCLDHGEMK